MEIKCKQEFRNIFKMLYYLKNKNKISYNNGLKKIKNCIIKTNQFFFSN